MTYSLAIGNSTKDIQCLCNTCLEKKMPCKENWNCPIFTNQQLAKWLSSLGLCISSQSQWSPMSAERCWLLLLMSIISNMRKKGHFCTHFFFKCYILALKGGRAFLSCQTRNFKKHSFTFTCVASPGNLQRLVPWLQRSLYLAAGKTKLKGCILSH